jgi:hypothetical protein
MNWQQAQAISRAGLVVAFQADEARKFNLSLEVQPGSDIHL